MALQLKLLPKLKQRDWFSFNSPYETFIKTGEKKSSWKSFTEVPNEALEMEVIL